MTAPERLRARRCLGLRVAVFFAVLFGVYYRGDWALVAVFAAGGALAGGAYWRDCRQPAGETEQTDRDTEQTDTHTRDL